LTLLHELYLSFFTVLIFDISERRFGNDINQVPTVVDGVARYITFQDVISLDWNLDELKDAVKKFRPELFVLFGNFHLKLTSRLQLEFK